MGQKQAVSEISSDLMETTLFCKTCETGQTLPKKGFALQIKPHNANYAFQVI